MLVAGVDGCKKGWLVVRAEAGKRLRLLDTSITKTFDELLATTSNCAAVAIDIPIGLSEDEYLREADREAKRKLGWPRMTSVFPAPPRLALKATTYDEAKRLCFRACGKKISRQAYGILPKVAEANDVMTRALQRRIIEVHPEVSLWALNSGEAMSFSKKKPKGAEERLALLSAVFENDLTSIVVPPGAARNDLLDACVAAWTAWRFVRGEHSTLPPDPPVDARGLRMEIVY